MAYQKRMNKGNSYQNSSNNSSFQKKHSGCKTGITRTDGSPFTQGWNYSRAHGLVSFLAVVTKKTHTVTSKTGRQWLNVMVKVQKKLQKDVLFSGLMDVQTGKVIISDQNIVMNPKAPNGGYCGKIK